MSQWKLDVGPLLRYDTVDTHGIYHAFALVVTEHVHDKLPDQGPVLYYMPTAEGCLEASTTRAPGCSLWIYTDEKGKSHVFWRFKIEVQLLDVPQLVKYLIPGAKDAAEFHVPALQANFRWAAYSCSGFSTSVDQDEWGGADPMWRDLLAQHAQQPFHMLMGGGDQRTFSKMYLTTVYNDKVAQEPELSEVLKPIEGDKANKAPVTPEIESAIDRFFFFNYITCFGSGAFAKATAQIPMVNMLDDHDLIDGFGTYPDDLMLAPVFNRIGSRGYFFYLLFQQFINDEVDGVSNTDTSRANPTPFRSMIIGGPGAYIPYPTHSLMVWLGPKQAMLLIDCRAQRKITQICAADTYKRCFEAIKELPSSVEHLIVQLGVPISYPRMVYLEKILSSNNPFIKLIKRFVPAFTNNFNGQVELLDDLNDHWCAQPHKSERNKFIEQMQALAILQHVRITFISGDVHAGGCGVFFSAGLPRYKPINDPKYMLAVITSAIVNAPPPGPVISIVNRLAGRKHHSLHYTGTHEEMLPLFEKGLDDKNSRLK